MAEEINLKNNRVGFVLCVFATLFYCWLYSCGEKMDSSILPIEVLI